MISDIIDDYHQSIDLNKQKIIFNLIGLDPELKYFRSIFKVRSELIDSIKILQQKCFSDGLIREKKIEQTMKFYKINNNEHIQDEYNRSMNMRDEKLLCKTVVFKAGRQKGQLSHILRTVSHIDCDLVEKSIPYNIELMEIIDTEDIQVNDCIAMVADLKLCLNINNWVLHIILSKTWYNTDFKNNIKYRKILSIPEKAGSKKLTIHRLKEIKAKLLNSEFTTENFAKEVPYNYADVIKVQLEFNTMGGIYFNKSFINLAIKLLENSIIDTCRISAQDIYVKIATLLKLSNLPKYQSGEFGIKQLTSRVITLDHDILHKELIPAFGNYVVSEKTDGVTSTILILGKDIFITCGSIVYKFDMIIPPSLPPSKSIEALGLSKIDVNNTWIFDAEVIIDINGILTIVPFDIRMASSINIDNISFKYRLMFMNGLVDLKANKIVIKMKKWYQASNIKSLYTRNCLNDLQIDEKSEKKKIEGYIFAYLDSLNYTTSMYYANKIWKWKSSEFNTIDFLIQNCPENFKGKSPYISGGKHLYILCCGISKSIHQSLPNIKVEQSIIPNNANEYIPAIFSPSDKPYAHLYWSEQSNLHGEVGEFSYNINTETWNLLRLRSDRKIEVERGNYYGNDHKTAENNWFTINNLLGIDHLISQQSYSNQYSSKFKFITSIYENLVKHIIPNNETIINICPITIMECFNKYTSVIYAFNNAIESNRYIKDKYELAKKRIRFNSYYVQTSNFRNLMDKLKTSTIPISKNGVDNLILAYCINKNDQSPGFDSAYQGFETIKLYEEFINKFGKIIIIINEAPDTNTGIKINNYNIHNYKIKNIEDAFESAKYKKILDIPVNKWVYIPDPDLYDDTRILVFSRDKKINL